MHENEQTRRQLELLATTDGLTGLFNRRHFMPLAEAEINRARRYGRPVYVGLADLDFFKGINDIHGHAAGDEVLRSTSQLFRMTLRQSDWVCRYGGEEFAFVFTETTLEEVQSLAERRAQLRRDRPTHRANARSSRYFPGKPSELKESVPTVSTGLSSGASGGKGFI